jgi:hypothetical protein
LAQARWTKRRPSRTVAGMISPTLFDSYRSAIAVLSALEIVGAVVNPPNDYSLLHKTIPLLRLTTQHDSKSDHSGSHKDSVIGLINQVDVAVKPLEWGTPWSDLIKLVYVQRIVKLQYSKK